MHSCISHKSPAEARFKEDDDAFLAEVISIEESRSIVEREKDEEG